MKEDPPSLEEIARAYRACFETPAGEVVLADLDRVHLNRSSTNNGNNGYFAPHEIHIRAAEQNPILRIHELIGLSIEMDRHAKAQKIKANNPPEQPTESEDDTL